MMFTFHAHLGSPLLPPTSSLHVVGYEIKSLLVPCMIKLLWYASFPRFAVSRMMKMWGEKNKRKINNIWANMNTAWTWVGLVWQYGSCCGSWGWWNGMKNFLIKKRIQNDVLGLQHAGGTNNSQLSAISQPFTRRVSVSRGVVQCFMLCYHRTWWRRSGNGIRRRKLAREENERGKLLCMVVELCSC